ncbi:hypothetical protein [Leptothermofonsia sp. ETS-13]|uniref:hypothetical protein n=1 Tax=Leptothermofonsia sp. ETS-13 TaxID=3035696 RepID=UPI003BA2FACF
MQKDVLVDFYRAWMIQVVQVEAGFQGICQSPRGERMSDNILYLHKQTAWQAAIDLIDHYYACYEIKQFLREGYESGWLGFDEWQQLNQALDSDLPLKLRRVS